VPSVKLSKVVAAMANFYGRQLCISCFIKSPSVTSAERNSYLRTLSSQFGRPMLAILGRSVPGVLADQCKLVYEKYM